MAAGEAKAATGIAGLDEVLGGGFARDHTYLVEGEPGAGKTTVGLQFLLEGVRLGEPCLHVTLSETAGELRTVAAAHGWSLDGVGLFQPVTGEAMLDGGQQQSLLYSSDLELGEATRAILAEMERLRPADPSRPRVARTSYFAFVGASRSTQVMRLVHTRLPSSSTIATS